MRVTQLRQLVAGQHGGVTGVADQQTRTLGDAPGRRRVVTGDHDDANACRTALRDGVRYLRPDRVGQSDQAEIFKVEIVFTGWPRRIRRAAIAGAGGGQHAQAIARHAVHLTCDTGSRSRAEVAEIDDGLWRALGGHHKIVAVARLPHLCHRPQLGREPVAVRQRPVSMQVLGVGEKVLAEAVKRLFHRIERVWRAGENGVLDQRMKGFRQFAAFAVVDVERGAAGLAAGAQPGDGHAVLGQCAGLVGAQHRGGSQRLNGRDSPCQHFFLRQPPGAERRKHRHHHRIFLGQQRHRQRDTGQQRLQPVATQQAVDADQYQTQANRQYGEIAYQRGGLHLQRRAFDRKRRQRGADAANGAAWTRCCDACHTLPLHDEGAGVDVRLVIAAGRGRTRGGGRGIWGGDLAHRHRLAGQQRFVGHQVVAFDQDGVRRHPVALGEQQHVASNHIATGDPLRLTVADNPGTRTGQVAQCLQCPLGLALLIQREAQHDQHRSE